MLLQDYLSNRLRRTKFDSKFSSWKKIVTEVPLTECFMLGPILFNIFIFDMFLFLHEAQFTGYADNNTSFLIKGNITDEISPSEKTGKKETFNLVL